MLVKELIKELEKMPQNEEVGTCAHDYDCGDSDSICDVSYIEDHEVDNDSGVADRRVVICN